MGELSSTQVPPSRPFLTTGVHYAGPTALRLGTAHSKMITKGYIARFVCFVTKTVHIEVVTSSSTEAFPAALRRFIARRGKPKTIYSDNGNNFQGAANELHKNIHVCCALLCYVTREFPALKLCAFILVVTHSQTHVSWKPRLKDLSMFFFVSEVESKTKVTSNDVMNYVHLNCQLIVVKLDVILVWKLAACDRRVYFN